MNELPTIKAELDRKVGQSLDWLITSIDAGKISEEQFSTGVNSLFVAVSGLVDESFIEIVTKCQAECGEHETPVLSYAFHAQGEPVIRKAVWRVGSSTVTFFTSTMGMVTAVIPKELESPKDAKAFINNFAKSMRKSKWLEL